MQQSFIKAPRQALHLASHKIPARCLGLILACLLCICAAHYIQGASRLASVQALLQSTKKHFYSRV